MAECKKCVSEKVCRYNDGHNLYCKEDYDCPNFKNKADVVEVRRGEWNDNIIGFCNVCMECGAIVERTAIKNRSGELNYCPNCGAKMDGKDGADDGT